MVKEQKVTGLKVVAPPGSAFAYETGPHALKLHQVCVVVGKRGAGKTVAAVNVMSRMFSFDRIFIVSPTVGSNKQVLSALR
eukprot:2181971-Pleurochrysis_carterae.AAC.1